MYRSISLASVILSCFLSLPCKLHNFPKQEITLHSQTSPAPTAKYSHTSAQCLLLRTDAIRLAGALSVAVSSRNLLQVCVFSVYLFQVHLFVLFLWGFCVWIMTQNEARILILICAIVQLIWSVRRMCTSTSSHAIQNRSHCRISLILKTDTLVTKKGRSL